MTSWFGSGRLSEITGQISNFTKEVLTEGAEEVDDHATELRVTKNKLTEMEAICLAQKAELERQQQANSELSETVQSSELQINTISTEYRELLDQKEVKLKDLQQKHEEILHLNTQMLEESSSAVLVGTSEIVPASLSASSSLTHSHSVPSLHAGFPGDSQDFDDVISLQRELNRLRGEVQRAEGECRHWRQLASTKSPSPEENAASENLTSLKTQLKEVKQQLTDEIDQHQHERAALQDVHSQKVSTLKKRHKEELSELRQQLHACKKEDETDGDRQRHLENVNQKLTHDLEHTHAADRSKAHRIEELDKKLIQLQEHRDKLLEEQAKWELENGDLYKQISVMGEERQHMKQQLLELSQQVQQIKDKPDTLGLEACTSVPVKSTDEIRSPKADLTAENECLQQQLISCQDEINQFDMVRSDWLMEKEALEEVLVKLREQLKVKTGDHPSLLSAQDEEYVHKLEGKIESFKKELDSKNSELRTLATSNMKVEKETVQNFSSQLEQTVSQLQQIKEENETLKGQLLERDKALTDSTMMVEEQKQLLLSKSQELADLSMINDTTKTSESKYSQLEESYEALKKSQVDLEEERRQLVVNLEELDEQNQQAIVQLINTRDQVINENEDLKSNLKKLQEDVMSGEHTHNEHQTITRMEAIINELTAEKGQMDCELSEIKEKNHKAAMSLNELHMDKQELCAKIKGLQTELKESRDKVNSLLSTEQRCWQLEKEISEVLAAQRAEVEAQGGEAELTVSRLQADLGEANSKAGCLQNRVSDLDAEVENLYCSIKTLRASNERLELESEASQQSCAAIVEGLKAKNQHEVQELQEKLCSLQTENETMVRKVEQINQKITAQASHYEKCISELQHSTEIDSNSLQEDHEKLVKQNLRKDTIISELETDMHEIQSAIQITEDKNRSLSAMERNLLHESEVRDKEISSLRKENLSLKTLLSQNATQISDMENELSLLQSTEKDLEDVLQKNEENQTEINRLEASLSIMESAKLSENDPVKSFEDEVTQLKSQLESKNTLIQQFSQETEGLQHQLHAHEKEIHRLEEKNKENLAQLKQSHEISRNLENTVENMKKDHSSKSQLSDLQGKIQSIDQSEKDTNYEEISSNKDSNLSRTCSLQSLQNGDIEFDTPKDYRLVMKEVEKLRSIISQKDDVINQMNDSNASLLTLLEERSLAVHGNKALVDIHRLEGEMHSLRREKEQIMTILNEKSRECSTMKSEVHKLMSVVSAEKTALSKLQQDNQELRKQLESVNDPNQEMTKEAVKRLAQIIRDKDLEIESLSMKNESLLQLLQENPSVSSDDGASGASGIQLSSIVQERDNLSKQLALFQADREQIVMALNVKHQESMSYHAEIQRLTMMLSNETERQDKLNQQFTSLTQQFEDKQQSLLKSQNELLNYKQKYTDLSTNYHRVVQRQKMSQTSTSPSPVSQSPRDSPVPPHTEGSPIITVPQHTQATESIQASDPLFHERPTVTDPAIVQQLEDLKAVLHSHEAAFAEKDKLVREKEAAIRECDQKILLRDSTISDKDRLLAETNSRLHHIEQSHHIKESEINNSRKQHEHLSFQLQGATKELEDLQQEVEQLTKQNRTFQEEMTAATDANSRLTLALNNKDFELTSLKEKVVTLTQLLKVAEGGASKENEEGHGEVTRLMQELEGVRLQSQTTHQERDQLHLALQQTQSDAHQAHQQSECTSQRNHKLEQEVERLRHHLLQVEEGYTAEALASEDREKDLRNRLAAAEEKALTSASAVHNANQHAVQQVEQLQTQLYGVAEQRDSALLQLASAQETANQYATSLTNLQAVLEQFQMEKETMLAAEIERYQREASVFKGENARLLDEIKHLKIQLEDTTEALEAAQRLSEQLDRKEEMIAALREEVQLREMQLKHAEEELHKLTSSTEAKVDKDLVKNMVLGYFHTNAGKKREALRLIGRVLDFSPQEIEEIGAGEDGGGWLGGLFKRAAPTPPTTPVRKTATALASALTDTSFSELFVKFLEKESSPQPTMKLPTDRMVAEQQKRLQEQQHRKPPAFNPFSAQMHSSVPLVAPGAQTNTESHLLMKPISSSLPLFSATPAPLVAPSSDSPESSGRSTPASSGAILKEVLQR